MALWICSSLFDNSLLLAFQSSANNYDKKKKKKECSKKRKYDSKEEDVVMKRVEEESNTEPAKFVFLVVKVNDDKWRIPQHRSATRYASLLKHH